MLPSWDQLCGRARNVSACAACPSALHGRTSSADSTPDEAGGGRQKDIYYENKSSLNTIIKLLQ